MTPPCYTTRDRYLASFVLSAGGLLVDVQRLGPKKVDYCFVAGPELHALLRQYWGGAPIPLTPSRLFDCLRALKSLSQIRP
jgi:hypothetical protein